MTMPALKKSDVLALAAECSNDWSAAQVADYCYQRLVEGVVRTPEQARAHWQIRQWVGATMV